MYVLEILSSRFFPLRDAKLTVKIKSSKMINTTMYILISIFGLSSILELTYSVSIQEVGVPDYVVDFQSRVNMKINDTFIARKIACTSRICISYAKALAFSLSFLEKP